MDDSFFGFGDGENTESMGLCMRLLLWLKPGEVMDDVQRRQLVRKLQMRKKDGGLGITSLRDVGEYAHVAALADVLNAKSKVLNNVDSIRWLKGQVSAGGGGSRLANKARTNIEAFAGHYDDALNKLEGMRSGASAVGRAPTTMEHIEDKNNNVTQEVMTHVVSMNKRLRWVAEATDDERLRDIELSGGDWQIPLTAMPTDRHLQVTNAAYLGHLRYALGLEKECPIFCYLSIVD